MRERTVYHAKGKDPMFKVWHNSDCSLIIYMHSDGGSIVCAEKSYPIQKGALCFIGAGKYHYTMPDDQKAYDRSKLFISPTHLGEILKVLPQSEHPYHFSDESFVYALIDEKERANVEKLFEEAARYEDDVRYRELILLSCAAKLLFYLDRYALESTPRVSGYMSEAVEYINRNFLRDVDIDEICAAVHISKYYFCRRFKQETGMTVMEYILKMRIVMAKEMLVKEKCSVTEVASRCGFSSLSYFSRVFKENVGMSPYAYRKSGKLR